MIITGLAGSGGDNVRSAAWSISGLVMQWFSMVFRALRSGRGIDVYVVILLTVIIATLDVFGAASARVISATTLAVLALVASSVVSGQRQVVALESQLQAFSSSLRRHDS